MALRDELGIRMKNFYESVPKTKLLRRTPVAIRIDGKAFHSFTRGMKKPFDFILIESMQKTMQYLCENIQGCVLGYTQSDEITLLLIDYKRLNSDAWFDYEVQKMCSIAASMATMAFNRYFAEAAAAAMEDGVYAEALQKAVQKGAMFDARCFNVPKAVSYTHLSAGCGLAWRMRPEEWEQWSGRIDTSVYDKVSCVWQ